MFTLSKTTKAGRLGTIKTPHGLIPTPVFMPVATAGAMKGITLDDLKALNADMMLCNTYHLHLSPGENIIEEAGGLHGFASWDLPILTDSGGFQVFSLEAIRTISDEGVEFRDHRNGDLRFIGPKEAIQIQHKLGADIIMCFDECPASTASRTAQIKAVDRTLLWAKICKEEHERLKKKRIEVIEKNKKTEKKSRGKLSKNLSAFPAFPSSPLLFGIVQGGLERDLREKCANELIAIGFDGYAIGGLAVGESEEDMLSIVDCVCPLLPPDKPRYLMGVGERHQMKATIAKGIDMFDCVSPMREARHGNIWMSDGSKLRIQRREFQTKHVPIDPKSPAPTSRKHLLSYLHHLMRIGERYGETLACLQNIGVTLESIQEIRRTINKMETK